MGFSVSEVPDIATIEATNNRIKGKLEPIAVLAWFSASGEITPLHFKYRTEDGDIISVKKIFVYMSERYRRIGHEIMEFHCKVEDCTALKEVIFVYNYDN